jgi:hypothetical protein
MSAHALTTRDRDALVELVAELYAAGETALAGGVPVRTLAANTQWCHETIRTHLTADDRVVTTPGVIPGRGGGATTTFLPRGAADTNTNTDTTETATPALEAYRRVEAQADEPTHDRTHESVRTDGGSHCLRITVEIVNPATDIIIRFADRARADRYLAEPSEVLGAVTHAIDRTAMPVDVDHETVATLLVDPAGTVTDATLTERYVAHKPTPAVDADEHHIRTLADPETESNPYPDGGTPTRETLEERHDCGTALVRVLPSDPDNTHGHPMVGCPDCEAIVREESPMTDGGYHMGQPPKEGAERYSHPSGSVGSPHQSERLSMYNICDTIITAEFQLRRSREVKTDGRQQMAAVGTKWDGMKHHRGEGFGRCLTRGSAASGNNPHGKLVSPLSEGVGAPIHVFETSSVAPARESRRDTVGTGPDGKRDGCNGGVLGHPRTLRQRYLYHSIGKLIRVGGETTRHSSAPTRLTTAMRASHEGGAEDV